MGAAHKHVWGRAWVCERTRAQKAQHTRPYLLAVDVQRPAAVGVGLGHDADAPPNRRPAVEEGAAHELLLLRRLGRKRLGREVGLLDDGETREAHHALTRKQA